MAKPLTDSTDFGNKDFKLVFFSLIPTSWTYGAIIANSFNSLARDLNVNLAVFNPIETIAKDFVYDESLYFDVMRDNLSNLLFALGN